MVESTGRTICYVVPQTVAHYVSITRRGTLFTGTKKVAHKLETH